MATGTIMARHRTAFILTGSAGKGAYSAGILKALNTCSTTCT